MSRIRNKLKNSGITAKGLAVALGVAQSTVCLWINGRRFPRKEYLIEINKITNGDITSDDFLFTANQKKQDTLKNYGTNQKILDIIAKKEALKQLQD